MNRSRVFLSVLMLALIAGLPVAQAELATLEQPIINGSPDTDPDHMAVVAIVWDFGQWWSLCSGTLIGPRVILTAAHCTEIPDKTKYWAYFGPNTQDGVAVKVSHVVTHPDYFGLFGTNDVALMRLEHSAPASIQPIPHLPAELALTDEDVQTSVQFTGFGRTEKASLWNKLTVFTPITWVCPTAVECGGIGFPIGDRVFCYDQTEVGGPCSGDSGGPAFIRRDNVEYVAGVTSYGDGACQRIGCSVKVDEYDDFISAYLEATGKKGDACTEDLQCYTGHCADGVCCDYACDSPCEACNQAGSEGSCLRVTDDSVEDGCGGGGGCATTGTAGSPWGALPLGLGLTALLFGLAVFFGRRSS